MRMGFMPMGCTHYPKVLMTGLCTVCLVAAQVIHVVGEPRPETPTAAANHAGLPADFHQGEPEPPLIQPVAAAVTSSSAMPTVQLTLGQPQGHSRYNASFVIGPNPQLFKLT